MGETLKGQDIVVISQQSWDTDLGSNCKDLAFELSKYNRVLYVNSPVDRISLIRRRLNPSLDRRLTIVGSRGNNLFKIKRGLWNLHPSCIVESINWIDNPKVFNFFNKRNNSKFSDSIKDALNTLGFKNFLLLNDSEIFKAFYLVEYLKPRLSIYYSRDNMLAVTYWKKHGSRLEPELIKKSDLCFTNSEYLAHYCRNYNADTFNVGQGFRIEDFIASPKERPSALQPIERKIIGYVGALNGSRLDIDIISKIALSFPEIYVVLIGPQDEIFKTCKLHYYSNIIFLGQKDVREVASYINAFDVCINPQLVNELTIGNYPRKIDEYLSLGKPVVATKTMTMEVFKEVVYLAEHPDDFVAGIREALLNTDFITRQQRINIALSHSWENSVLQMTKQIKQKLNH